LVMLNRTVQLNREQQRENIRGALSRTHTRNRQSREHSGHMHNLLTSELRMTEMSKLEEKRVNVD
jgi:hypothetical protein